MKILNLIKTPWIMIPVVLLGVGIAIGVKNNQAQLVHEKNVNDVTSASYITLKSHLIRPQINAYGEVKPATC